MSKYRKNIGIVVFNKDKKVFMGKRVNCHTTPWQFPQGGIDANESLKDAARRELSEETGIKTAELICITEKSFKYNFPKEAACCKFGYIGQEQWWALFFFDGNDNEIDFCTFEEEIEFCEHQWVDIAKAPELVVSFKKDVYMKVVAKFEPIIANWKK